jgi:uncharacterized membrane protein
MMDLTIFSEYVASIIGVMGVIIMCIGAVRSVGEFIYSYIKRIDRMTDIRIMLVKHLSLGLEFLVAKDIIDSIIEPTIERLTTLGIIIVLRTAIAYVLHWELKEARVNLREETKLTTAIEEFEDAQKEHKRYKSNTK